MKAEVRASQIIPVRFDFSFAGAGSRVPDPLRDAIAVAIRDAEAAMRERAAAEVMKHPTAERAAAAIRALEI